MTTAALIVAILGVVLAAASLGWQAATFALSGPRVRLSLRHGAAGHGGVVTNRPGKFDVKWAAEEGYAVEVLAVETINVGRMPVSITRVVARFPNGMAVHETQNPISSQLPYRLEPQSKETFYLSMELVRRAAYATSKATGESIRAVWLEIELGNGKILRTPESLELAAG